MLSRDQTYRYREDSSVLSSVEAENSPDPTGTKVKVPCSRWAASTRRMPAAS
jgi:hypothetical protein